MGNVQAVPEAHLRMYENLLNIKAPGTRVQMIQTILSSPEHLASVRAVGVYGHLLHYVQVLQAGGAAPKLPGEKVQGQGQAHVQAHTQAQVHAHVSQRASATAQRGQSLGGQELSIHVGSELAGGTQKGNERAMNYFSACLRILDLEEEVALTEEALKGAYKKAVVRAHPDKGGSEKEFEAVTRAYAYLGEILRRIHGGRTKEGKMDAPAALKGGRENDADAWKMVEPVRLNPNKLDMNTFNSMYEQTRIPDPEESGYGDWLKGEDVGQAQGQGAKFTGKFNRDVFHRAFEDEQKGRPAVKGGVMTVQEQSLASRLGYATELGRTARDDYTVAANDPGLKFTDLKKAYTEYNTFSQNTSDVRIENRTLDQYSQERDKAPAPLANFEMAALAAAEKAASQAEEKRKLRMAQESVSEGDYFERMKRLVIRN